MERERFSHPHPLVLKEEGQGFVCSGCEEPISDPCYRCTSCSFFLHEKCSELPLQINRHVLHPEPDETDDKSAGNSYYTTQLREKGYIGFWRYPEDTCSKPTPIEIQVIPFFEGIRNTVFGVLERFFQRKTQLPGQIIVNRVSTTADTLACGCCVTAFLKVRNLVISELPSRHAPISLKRPRASEELVVPSGFAFAIQQLGIVNVADTPRECIYVPCFPNEGHTSGIPNDRSMHWNPNAYALAVEYARALGMQFAVVDLKKKAGSAWWLFRQTFAEDIFELECPIPEVNFTEAMAVVHAMFLDGNNNNPSGRFVDIAPLGDHNYGTMMRNPHQGIHLNCFEAIV